MRVCTNRSSHAVSKAALVGSACPPEASTLPATAVKSGGCGPHVFHILHGRPVRYEPTRPLCMSGIPYFAAGVSKSGLSLSTVQKGRFFWLARRVSRLARYRPSRSFAPCADEGSLTTWPAWIFPLVLVIDRIYLSLASTACPPVCRCSPCALRACRG